MYPRAAKPSRLAFALSLLVLACSPKPAPGNDPGDPPVENTQRCGAIEMCGAHASCHRSSEPQCVCDPGYRGDGVTCVDEDECAHGQSCGGLGRCVNVVGGHRCECDAGAIEDGGTCRRPFPPHLALGSFGGCDVRSDGTLWCWGDPAEGGLLARTSDYRPVPTRIASERSWASVSRRNTGACGIATDGTLWEWGINAFPASGFSQVPRQVGTDGDWTSCGVDSEGGCGIRRDGSLWCWGGNQFATVGDGTLTPHPQPVRVGTDTDWTRVSMGYTAACALKRDRSAWCWGAYSKYGPMAASTPASLVPARFGPYSDWEAFEVRDLRACGIRAGGLWCWGLVYETVEVDTPLDLNPTPVLVGNGPFTQLALGAHHVCVLGEGKVSCFGSNDRGQLGVGHLRDSRQLVQAGSDTDFVDLASGDEATCARRRSGVVACWGWNENGGLGFGAEGYVLAPTRIGTARWLRVGASIEATCGVQADRSLWCAGSGHGNGNGTGEAVARFEKIGTDTDWADVAGGERHLLARKTDNSLWAWGRNDFGQCGVGTTSVHVSSPQRVGTENDWVELASGYSHSCGRRSDNSVWCWGAGATAQAPGDELPKVPAQVPGSWTSLSSASNLTCAVDTSGAIWCWGQALAGEYQDTTDYSLSPRRVGTRSDWKQVGVADRMVCGLTTGGEIFCWGGSPYQGAPVSITPVKVGGNDWIRLFSGPGGAGGERKDHSVWTFSTDESPSDFALQGFGVSGPYESLFLGSPMKTCAIAGPEAALWCKGVNQYGDVGAGMPWVATPTNQGVR